jgi:hypothetical protein
VRAFDDDPLFGAGDGVGFLGAAVADDELPGGQDLQDGQAAVGVPPVGDGVSSLWLEMVAGLGGKVGHGRDSFRGG